MKSGQGEGEAMFRSVSEDEMKRRKAILIKNVEDGFR